MRIIERTTAFAVAAAISLAVPFLATSQAAPPEPVPKTAPRKFVLRPIRSPGMRGVFWAWCLSRDNRFERLRKHSSATKAALCHSSAPLRSATGSLGPSASALTSLWPQLRRLRECLLPLGSGSSGAHPRLPTAHCPLPTAPCPHRWPQAGAGLLLAGQAWGACSCLPRPGQLLLPTLRCSSSSFRLFSQPSSFFSLQCCSSPMPALTFDRPGPFS